MKVGNIMKIIQVNLEVNMTSLKNHIKCQRLKKNNIKIQMGTMEVRENIKAVRSVITDSLHLTAYK